MVPEQLQGFLDDSFAFDPFQSSFRSAYGKEMALVALVYDLCLETDKENASLLILSAAFVTNDHLILLQCWECGIRNRREALECFKSKLRQPSFTDLQNCKAILS